MFTNLRMKKNKKPPNDKRGVHPHQYAVALIHKAPNEITKHWMKGEQQHNTKNNNNEIVFIITINYPQFTAN